MRMPSFGVFWCKAIRIKLLEKKGKKIIIIKIFFFSLIVVNYTNFLPISVVVFVCYSILGSLITYMRILPEIRMPMDGIGIADYRCSLRHDVTGNVCVLIEHSSHCRDWRT